MSGRSSRGMVRRLGPARWFEPLIALLVDAGELTTDLRQYLIVDRARPFAQLLDGDLLITVPVLAADLALGAKVEVPTVSGRVSMKIPAGTHSHKIFRIPNRGIPHLHGPGRGDQLVRVVAWTPDKLSGDEKEILEKLRELQKGNLPAPGRQVYDG